MTCQHAHHDGAYVLGALSSDERLEFERHLGSCRECARAVRELAGLPGLLGRIDVEVLGELDAPAPDVPLPATLLPRLHREVRRRGRRRLVAAGVAAAVVTVLAASAAVSLTRPNGPHPPAAATPAVAVRMAPVGDAPVHAALALEPVAWGTRLDLTCTYDPGTYAKLPSRATYTLVVRTRDGRQEQVGTWGSLEGRPARLAAATATNRADIASVEVQTAQGQPVLRLAR